MSYISSKNKWLKYFKNVDSRLQRNVNFKCTLCNAEFHSNIRFYWHFKKEHNDVLKKCTQYRLENNYKDMFNYIKTLKRA